MRLPMMVMVGIRSLAADSAFVGLRFAALTFAALAEPMSVDAEVDAGVNADADAGEASLRAAGGDVALLSIANAV